MTREGPVPEGHAATLHTQRGPILSDRAVASEEGAAVLRPPRCGRARLEADRTIVSRTDAARDMSLSAWAART
jgi:hypothetical protein